MADGRRNNGGHKTAGRKSKAEELKAAEQGLNAIIEKFGSVEAYWQHIAEQAKSSYPHLKLIHEHIYGKATERKELFVEGDIPTSLFQIDLMNVPGNDSTTQDSPTKKEN